MDMGLYSVTSDREADMREVNLNVDYENFVPEIQEDLDTCSQDKDVKKKKGTQQKIL